MKGEGVKDRFKIKRKLNNNLEVTGESLLHDVLHKKCIYDPIDMNFH